MTALVRFQVRSASSGICSMKRRCTFSFRHHCSSSSAVARVSALSTALTFTGVKRGVGLPGCRLGRMAGGPVG